MYLFWHLTKQKWNTATCLFAEFVFQKWFFWSLSSFKIKTKVIIKWMDFGVSFEREMVYYWDLDLTFHSIQFNSIKHTHKKYHHTFLTVFDIWQVTQKMKKMRKKMKFFLQFLRYDNIVWVIVPTCRRWCKK